MAKSSKLGACVFIDLRAANVNLSSTGTSQPQSTVKSSQQLSQIGKPGLTRCLVIIWMNKSVSAVVILLFSAHMYNLLTQLTGQTRI